MAAELQQPGKFSHCDVKEILEQWISELIENNKKVELADDFFVNANIRIITKDRNKPLKRLLISEQDTSQENLTDETTRFCFRSSFEEMTSVSLATSQGFTANIGGGLSGGVMVPNLGLSSGLEFSKSKSFGQDKSRAQNKELTAEVEVQPHTVVIVKELTYEVEWTAMCDLELILRKEDKIEYKCMGIWSKEESNSIEVKKLLPKIIARKKKQISSSSTQSNPMPASPKGTFPRTRSQLHSVAVHDPNLKDYPTPLSPESNTSLSGGKLKSSSIEHIKETELSPTPPSPKAKSIHIQLPRQVKISDHESTAPSPGDNDRPPYDASVCLSSPDYNRSVAVDHLREREHLLQHASVDSPVSLLTENVLAIKFTSDCLFSAEEHKLEIIKLPSDSDRVKRIIDHQTSLPYQNDKEDTQLSLKVDKYTSS